MALTTTSTFVALPEVRHRQLAGTFEPSTELLNKLRALLISPSTPITYTPTSNQKLESSSSSYILSHQRPQVLNYGSAFSNIYPSSLPRSEPKDIRIIKTNQSPTSTSSKPSRSRKSSHDFSLSPSQPQDMRASNTHRSPKHSSKHSRFRKSPEISLQLIHPNVLDPWDNLPDESSGYATTFSTTITLRDLICSSKRMTSEKVDGYFKQAISGLEYLHRTGIAHQNLCPENFIITISNVLKIFNFEMVHHNGSRSSQRSSVPKNVEYAAPEDLVDSSFDAKAADMWAMGVIYMEMRRGRLLWDVAAEGADDCYDRYLQFRAELWGYRPIENLNNEHCRRVINSLLDPVPGNRYSASRVMKSAWCTGIQSSVV